MPLGTSDLPRLPIFLQNILPSVSLPAGENLPLIMPKTALLELFERDLRKLAEEINLYEHEADLWAIKPGISNSAGNLCLHLVGNLQHFVGTVLGNTGYVRDRDSEFTLKNVPRQELLAGIEDTIQVVTHTLREMPDAAWEQVYPVPKRDQIVQTDYMLLHLFGHLSYHLGQVNYHRRLVGDSIA